MAEVEVRSDTKSPQRWDPFAEMDRMRRELDALWAKWPMALPGTAGSTFEPLADVEEADDAWIVEVELPGVKKKDIDIEVSGRTLRIAAERKEKERKGILRQQKRVTGRFRYEVALPSDFDAAAVSATLSDGELTVRVPKSAMEQPRKIKVV